MQTILWKGWIQDILTSSKLLFLLKIRTLNFCVLWFFFLVFVLVAFGTALIMIAQVSVFHYSFLFSMNIRWTFSEDNRTKYDPKAWDAWYWKEQWASWGEAVNFLTIHILHFLICFSNWVHYIHLLFSISHLLSMFFGAGGLFLLPVQYLGQVYGSPQF